MSRTWIVGAITFVVAVGFPLIGILTAEAREVEVMPGTVDYVFVALIALVTLLIFGLVVPRGIQGNTGRTGLILSILAVVTVVAFWTMLPIILGAAGALLGYEARSGTGSTEPGSRMPMIAIVLGALAVVATLIIYPLTF
jgi:hypothetical protein